jgi:hypothetical protein
MLTHYFDIRILYILQNPQTFSNITNNEHQNPRKIFKHTGKLYIQQSTKISRTEEYLHRVGRTARIGKSGSALLFLQPSELGFLDVLRGRGLTDLREMPLEELMELVISLSLYENGVPSGYVKIAMEIGPFIVDLPIINGNFP